MKYTTPVTAVTVSKSLNGHMSFVSVLRRREAGGHAILSEHRSATLSSAPSPSCVSRCHTEVRSAHMKYVLFLNKVYICNMFMFCPKCLYPSKYASMNKDLIDVDLMSRRRINVYSLSIRRCFVVDQAFFTCREKYLCYCRGNSHDYIFIVIHIILIW